jgi:two-component system chemotaxis response regulator CheV
MGNSQRSLPKRRNRILLDCGTNEVEFLRFFIMDKFFGMNVSKVRRAIVFEPDKVSVIPQRIPGHYGTYLYRGSCIPILSFREYFGMGPEVLTERTILLVCEFNQCTVGYIVDKIKDIVRCSWDDFRPTRQLENSSSVLSGNLLAREEITPILDVEEMLAKLLPEAGIERAYDRLEKTTARGSLAGKKIVYCEDSPTVQKVLMKCLQDLGFQNILPFATGKEGLDYLVSHPNEVDLIISDIEMPQLDGLTLCKETKALAQAQEIPFIFFSSTVTEEMRFKCESVGGIAAFSKPQIKDLAEYIDKLFA